MASRIARGWMQFVERVRPVVDLDPFRKQREALDEDARRRQEWRRRLDEVANTAFARPALPGEGAEAQARRQVAAVHAAVAPMLRDPTDPVVMQFFLDHYRKELRRMLPRNRGESKDAYAARCLEAIKALMRDYADEDLPLSEFHAYLDTPPRAPLGVLLDGFISWLNWQSVLGLAVVFIFVWAGPRLAAWINTTGRALFGVERVGNASWAWLLLMVVSLSILVWAWGGWGILARWMKKR